MTDDERKNTIEKMVQQFMEIEDPVNRSMVIVAMSAYAEGKAAGKEEERKRKETESDTNG